tara:strand:+ start:4950 stop:6785 length:1836 start_codon:yes stop_codon:yes gene_type:complete
VKKILGISAFYHDSAAAITFDENIIAAAQEERFTRIKHDSKFPFEAIKYCLNQSSCRLNELDYIVFFEKPFLKFERLLETYLGFAPKGLQSFSKAMPIWIKEKLFQKNLIFNYLKEIDKSFSDMNKIKFSTHHLSHAASAFYPSPFKDAIILTLDGVGEWASSTIGLGENNKLKIVNEINFPHSLGLLYSAFTYYLGFKVNSGEYKVMGLAPYGDPKYVDLIKKNLVDIKSDGSYRINMKYFDYATGLKMINDKFEELFGKKRRDPKYDKLENFHMDIASSIQKVLEDIVILMCKYLKNKFNKENLCLAGGVALNCVANGKILKEKIFKNIWIQPAAGDAGGALGASLAYYHLQLSGPRENLIDKMQGAYLGPSFNNSEIEKVFNKLGANYKIYTEENLYTYIAKLLTEEKAIGWFQGRMEFGPRALGARSIIADPRSEKMQKNLNLKVKFRESFRPFAPSVLSTHADKFFNIQTDSPYMMLVSNIRENLQIAMDEDQKKMFGIEKLNIKRSSIPAVTHVDYSARIQTVDGVYNKKYFKLIKKFNEISNCPVLVNTSFNVRGEPIVCNPEDAYNCFMGTNLDVLVCENYVLLKKDQNKKNITNYKDKFKLD